MERFFAAANTEEGFLSRFDEIFSPETLRRIYILKGGPGTGKSTLMRAVAEAALANGTEAEVYLCSSDTDSLDGVLLPSLGVAVLDGTAPHKADPKYPGAVERIVNLGEMLDNAALERARARIIALTHEKSDTYRTAYRYLSAAGRMARETETRAEPAFLTQKADDAIARLLASLRAAKVGAMRVRYVSAIGTHGIVTLPTLRERAARTVGVTDKFGLGYLFMARLRTALLRAKIEATSCPSPLIPTRTESLFIEGERLLLSVLPEEEAARCDKCIAVSRFYTRELLAARRASLRFSEKCESALMGGALDSLAAAGRAHAALEEIYGAAADFARVREVGRTIIAEIFAEKA